MSRSQSRSPIASVTRVRSSMNAYAMIKPTVRTGRLDRVTRPARAVTASSSGPETSTQIMRAVTNGTVTTRRSAVMATPRDIRASHRRPARRAGRFGGCRGTSDSTMSRQAAAASRLEARAQ